MIWHIIIVAKKMADKIDSPLPLSLGHNGKTFLIWLDLFFALHAVEIFALHAVIFDIIIDESLSMISQVRALAEHPIWDFYPSDCLGVLMTSFFLDVASTSIARVCYHLANYDRSNEM